VINKNLKIIIIISIVIISGVIAIVVLSNKSGPQVIPNPVQLSQLNQLPVETEEFRITYNLDQNTLTIVPKIPFDSSQAPQLFFKKYWSQYQTYGQNALKWLNEHQMDKIFRETYGVKLIWWGEEWWPEGASISEK